MKSEAEEPSDDSQNEKTVVDILAVKHPKKAPQTNEFVDTDRDDEQERVVKKPQKALKITRCPGTDDEQERVVIQPKKAPKTPEFVDTDSDDSDDEQELAVKKLQKESKASGLVDTDSSTEDEQGPAVKHPQKASKIPGRPDDEDPQETSPVHKHFHTSYDGGQCLNCFSRESFNCIY